MFLSVSVIPQEIQSGTQSWLFVGSESYIATGIFSRTARYRDPLESMFRRCTLAIKSNLLAEFQKPVRDSLQTIPKEQSKKVQRLQRKETSCVSKYLWKRIKACCFKLFLSSFTDLFAHTNPQESKTQILSKSLHRTLFLFLYVLLKALCSALQEHV